jgi:diguanylate cyclase (GGDEF)-like protein
VGEKPFSLLVVDDSRSTAARLVQALGSQEYAPRVMPPSPEVSRLAREVDLVLFCLEPAEDLTLLRGMLDLHLGAPVIGIAPAEARQVRLAALRLGAEVVSDPWDTDELRARMQRVFSARQGLAALASQVSELQKLSVLDGLTLLHNYRYFQERLREEFRAAQRYDDTLSLIIVDLDCFKEVNERWGPPAGDDVLRMVAKVLQQNVRATDLVARYGGEEFAVLLPRTPLTGAITAAERIWKELGALRVGPEGGLQVTASLGVSSFPHRSVLSSDQLLLSADEALSRAKREGRNRICLHPVLPLLPSTPRS